MNSRQRRVNRRADLRKPYCFVLEPEHDFYERLVADYIEPDEPIAKDRPLLKGELGTI